MHTTFYTKDVKSGRSDCWLCDCMEEEKCLFSNGSMSIQQAAAWKCGFYDNKVSAQYKMETLLRESEILKKLYGIDWIGKHLP